MTLRVIGAGFGRTGTTSLKQALEQLGLRPCYHMSELLDHPQHATQWARAAYGRRVDWHALLSGYQATADWPACHFWAELLDAFPDAKVVLTIREPGGWYDSARRTIFRHAVAPLPAQLLALVAVCARPYGLVQLVMLQRMMHDTFAGRLRDRRHMTEVFTRHARHVQAAVPPDRLLVYAVADGWKPLCEFLGVAVPDAPFPHANGADEYEQRFEERLRHDRRVGLTRIAATLLGVLALARAGRVAAAARRRPSR